MTADEHFVLLWPYLTRKGYHKSFFFQGHIKLIAMIRIRAKYVLLKIAQNLPIESM